MRLLFTVLPSSTSSLTVKMNLTNILFSVSLILPISFSQILHPRGFSLFWALKRMRSMQHMTSSQNLTKSVLKTAKMQSGRKLRGMHMSCDMIFSAKNVTQGFLIFYMQQLPNMIILVQNAAVFSCKEPIYYVKKI